MIYLFLSNIINIKLVSIPLQTFLLYHPNLPFQNDTLFCFHLNHTWQLLILKSVLFSPFSPSVKHSTYSLRPYLNVTILGRNDHLTLNWSTCWTPLLNNYTISPLDCILIFTYSSFINLLVSEGKTPCFIPKP